MKRIDLLLTALLLLGWGSAQAVGQPADEGFGVRAFYVDFRTEVMTPAALDALAVDLSTKGINAVVMEWEATFPFEKHATLCNQNAFSRAEVQGFVSKCVSLGMDVIPLQNCFGHCEYILRHDRYRALREDRKEVSQVCPLKIDEAVKTFREIFAEVAELHPSHYFHIGADETYLLGHCKECAAVAATPGGKSKLFVDYVAAMSKLVLEMGKTPVIWADIILSYPEAVEQLPRELIFVDWNYGWDVNRFGKLDNLFRSGVKMWGGTSMRSAPDNLYLTQWEKHFNNLATFVPFAREKGYRGMIQTSWSTSGLYGFHYDNSNEIINMQPVRFVYPTAGFNILLDAYAHAVNSSDVLNPQQFVLEYARTRYGLDSADAQLLWDYFTMPQHPILIHGAEPRDDSGVALGKVLTGCVALKERFSKIKPRMGSADFGHYNLMLDIRINYLKFKEIESVYESPTYDRRQASALADKLGRVLHEEKELSRRFTELNRGYLKPGELEQLNSFRSEKMNALYLWLTHNK